LRGKSVIRTLDRLGTLAHMKAHVLRTNQNFPFCVHHNGAQSVSAPGGLGKGQLGVGEAALDRAVIKNEMDLVALLQAGLQQHTDGHVALIRTEGLIALRLYQLECGVAASGLAVRLFLGRGWGTAITRCPAQIITIIRLKLFGIFNRVIGEMHAPLRIHPFVDTGLGTHGA